MSLDDITFQDHFILRWGSKRTRERSGSKPNNNQSNPILFISPTMFAKCQYVPSGRDGARRCHPMTFIALVLLVLVMLFSSSYSSASAQDSQGSFVGAPHSQSCLSTISLVDKIEFVFSVHITIIRAPRAPGTSWPGASPGRTCGGSGSGASCVRT